MEATNTKQLRTGDRVTVYGKPGTITHFDGAWIGVNLDGEGRRIDLWQRSQIETAS